MKKLLFVCFLTIIFASCGISQGIKGRIIDKLFKEPVSVVTVKLQNIDDTRISPIITQPDDEGYYSISADPGTYRLEITDERQDFQYASYVRPVKIGDGVLEHNAEIELIVKTYIHGQVFYKGTKNPIEGAVVTIENLTSKTNKNGSFDLRYLKPGLKKVMVEKNGYKTLEKAYNLSSGETIDDFEIEPLTAPTKLIIKKLTDLLSYRLEIAQGASSDNMNLAASLIVINIPFSFSITAGDQEGIFMAEPFLKKDSKYNQVSMVAFKNLYAFWDDYTKVIDRASTELEKSGLKPLNAFTGEFEDYRFVEYNFTYKDEKGSNVDCKMRIAFDGPYKDFPIMISTSQNGKTTEIQLSAFNALENKIPSPK